jgi:hypothetical protein
VESLVIYEAAEPHNTKPRAGMANNLGRVSKLRTNFEELLARANGKFEEQNKFLKPSLIIINYVL